MHAQIGTVREPVLRVEIVSQRQIFDDNPTGFRCGGVGLEGGLAGAVAKGCIHACVCLEKHMLDAHQLGGV